MWQRNNLGTSTLVEIHKIYQTSRLLSEKCRPRNPTNCEKPTTHRPEIQSSKPKRHLKTISPKCFICGKEKSVDDEYNSDESPDFIQDKSQYHICKSCLQREDAFETYRETFLQKIQKYIK